MTFLKRGDRVYAVRDFNAFTIGINPKTVPIKMDTIGQYIGMHDEFFPKCWFQNQPVAVITPHDAIAPADPIQHNHE